MRTEVRRDLALLSLVVLAVLLLACSGGETRTEKGEVASSVPTRAEQAQATTTALAPTGIVQPTITAQLTSTPLPTDTSLPTSTPTLTSTPLPTDTPKPTSTPTPKDTPVPLGQIVSTASWDYMVTDVVVTASIGDRTARGSFVVALVKLTNKQATAREVGSQFLVAQDAQGRLYEMDTDASLEYHHVFKTDAWYLDDIGASATALVPVVFDVSPDAAGVVLLAAGTTRPAVLLIEDLRGESLTLPGDPQIGPSWSYLITDVGTATAIGDMTARGEYVFVVVTVRNEGLTPRELGSGFFLLRDGQGRVYDMSTDASLEYHQVFKTNDWYLEDIGPSLLGSIPVVFDVSPDATQLELQAQQKNAQPVSVLDGIGGNALEVAGESFITDNWEFSVQDAKIAQSIGDKVPKGQYVIAIVQVKNLATTARELGSEFFALRDMQKRTYQMDTGASLEYHQAYKTDVWYLEDIGPSLLGTIPIVFDVASDASEFALVDSEGERIPLP